MRADHNMNRLYGLQYLTFSKLDQKSVKGWSRYDPDTIDIGRVQSVKYRERALCLLDREYPFSLEITYYEPRDGVRVGLSTALNMVFLWGSKSTHIITRRFKTALECHKVIEEIKNGQNKLDWQADKFRKLLEYDP